MVGFGYLPFPAYEWKFIRKEYWKVQQICTTRLDGRNLQAIFNFSMGVNLKKARETKFNFQLSLMDSTLNPPRKKLKLSDGKWSHAMHVVGGVS